MREFFYNHGRTLCDEGSAESIYDSFTGSWIYAAIIIVVVLAVCIAIFDYTKFGYDYNALKMVRRLR